MRQQFGPILLFIALLLLDAVIMFFYKSTEQNGFNFNDRVFFIHALTMPTFWMAVGLSILELLIWTKILSLMDLSLAYPATSLSFPLTMMVGQIFFHEHLPARCWVGAVLITVGVSILQYGKTRAEQTASAFLP